MESYTTIRVSHETRKYLILLGAMGDSYDTVISKLIDAALETAGIKREEKGK